MGQQSFFGEVRSRLKNDTGGHQLSPLSIRNSEDGGFPNCRVIVNHAFDLAAVNVLAAGDNHILEAIQDVEVTDRILITDVTRAEETVSKG